MHVGAYDDGILVAGASENKLTQHIYKLNVNGGLEVMTAELRTAGRCGPAGRCYNIEARSEKCLYSSVRETQTGSAPGSCEHKGVRASSMLHERAVPWTAADAAAAVARQVGALCRTDCAEQGGPRMLPTKPIRQSTCISLIDVP